MFVYQEKFQNGKVSIEKAYINADNVTYIKPIGANAASYSQVYFTDGSFIPVTNKTASKILKAKGVSVDGCIKRGTSKEA